MPATRDLDYICVPTPLAANINSEPVVYSGLAGFEIDSSKLIQRSTSFPPSVSELQPCPFKNVGHLAHTVPRQEEYRSYADGSCETVWQVYLDEASKADSAMLDRWNRSIDVLLVFTGLFSAVVTTFVVESYKLLTESPLDTTNNLLSASIGRQNIALINSSVPSTRTYWVNALWFASLCCSLSTGFISMVAKHWLQPVVSLGSNSKHRDRARLRQLWFMKLNAWFVPDIINALPICLHSALFLFFAGLITLLWPVALGIAIAAGLLVSTAFTFYISSVLLPVWFQHCPYRHPISDYLCMSRASSIQRTNASRQQCEYIVTEGRDSHQSSLCWPLRNPSWRPSDDVLDASALAWLITESPDMDIRSTALVAIADFPRSFSAFNILRQENALTLAERGFLRCFHREDRWIVTSAACAELHLRVWLQLARGTNALWPRDLMDPLRLLQSQRHHHDAAAIASSLLMWVTGDVQPTIASLARHLSGQIMLSCTSQLWLINTLIECTNGSGLPGASIQLDARNLSSLVPVLLGILRQVQTSQPVDSSLRNAISLALYVCTCGSIDLVYYLQEECRERDYLCLVLRAFSAIINHAENDNIEDELVYFMAKIASDLASHIITSRDSNPVSHEVQTLVRACITKLFATGKYSTAISEESLSDLLQLISWPLVKMSSNEQSGCVASCLHLLKRSSHLGVLEWSLRLLEGLLASSSPSLTQVFIGHNGIDAVIRVAKGIDAINSGLVQQAGLRVLLAFVKSSSNLGRGVRTGEPADADLGTPFDMILRSDFLAFVVQTWIAPYLSVQSGTHLVYV